MSQYILEMENIRKEFLGGKIIANEDISLKVKEGEIHAIVGENGAGKSTLMKMLNGLYLPTSGKIKYKGKEVKIDSPSYAAKLGIGMVYQHFMLIDTLTVAENMVLGHEPHTLFTFDINKANQEVKKVAEKYGLKISPTDIVSDLSVGIHQRIEILKILFKGADILVFDEPSAVLTPQEVKELYKIMKNLIKEGKTIIFITHKLQEVLDISDNITIIRKGKNVGNLKTSEATKEKIATMMVGRKVLFEVKRPDVKLGKELVKISNLRVKSDNKLEAVKGINIDIREGEIFGIAGVEGNGQTELIEALAGLREIEGGKFEIGDLNITKASPRNRRDKGLSHIPEDRHKRAGIGEFTIEENMMLGVEKDYCIGYRINFKKIKDVTNEFIQKYDIRPPDSNALFGSLSGGNQQKVIVARELEKENKFIIASQPTRGVDIGAIELIHNIILKEKENKKSVLLVSAELSEVMALSDRIGVMYSGEIVGIINREEASIEKLGILMAGGKIDE